mmetsp:Transcript_26249/g.67737  ORF Transcript_26249/g.67737 Transcript_26249/m.67737 type:complete len:241 (-) Transcript_26249:323-1045(-)
MPTWASTSALNCCITALASKLRGWGNARSAAARVLKRLGGRSLSCMCSTSFLYLLLTKPSSLKPSSALNPVPLCSLIYFSSLTAASSSWLKEGGLGLGPTGLPNVALSKTRSKEHLVPFASISSGSNWTCTLDRSEPSSNSDSSQSASPSCDGEAVVPPPSPAPPNSNSDSQAKTACTALSSSLPVSAAPASGPASKSQSVSSPLIAFFLKTRLCVRKRGCFWRTLRNTRKIQRLTFLLT